MQKVKEQRCEIIKKNCFTHEISMDPASYSQLSLRKAILKNFRLDQLVKIRF